MENRIVILGHHNFGLALVINNLYENYGVDNDIFIIENMDPKDNPVYLYEYALDKSKIHKIQVNDWSTSPNDVYYLSTVSPSSRRKLFDEFKNNYSLSESKFPILKHPNVVIAKSSNIESGGFLGPNLAIGPFSHIGKFCHINRNVSIGHHCRIEDYVTVSHHSSIASCTHIEQDVLIGAGVTIFDGINIGKGSIIGAGSVVTKDIPRGVVAYGSPAKIVREVN